MNATKWLNRFQKYFTWVILAANIGVLCVIIVRNEEHRTAFTSGAHLRPGWIAVACGIYLLSVFLEGALTCFILRCYGERYALWRGARVALVTRYYSAITPTNLGGQPAAIVRLIGDGISPAMAGMSVGAHVVFFHFAQLFLQIVMLFFLPGLHLDVHAVLWVAMGVSMVCGGALTLALLLSILLPSWTQRAVHAIATAGQKLHLVRDREAFCERISKMIEPYRESLRGLTVGARIGIAVLALGQVILINLVAYAACRACGVRLDPLDCLWRMLFLNTAVNFLPIPGGMGAAEGAFYLIFGPVVPRGRIMLALVLWRTASYFLLLLLGSAESGLYALNKLLRHRAQPLPDKDSAS